MSRFKGGEKGSHFYSWRKNLSSRGNSQCKGSVAGMYRVAELRRTLRGDEFWFFFFKKGLGNKGGTGHIVWDTTVGTLAFNLREMGATGEF